MAYDRIGTDRWAWLKSVGSQETQLNPDWRLENDYLLTRVRFSKHPRSIRGGDLLVYYAAGHRVLPAIAEVASDEVEEDLNEPRWKWNMRVRPIITVGLRQAPGLADSPVALARVRRQSHIKLEADEFAAIREMLVAAAAGSVQLPDDS